MSTTFKVGDRVKLTGKAWAENYPAMHLKAVEVTGHDEDGVPTFIFDDTTWYIHQENGDWSATIVEPAAPAPDTRKRLRDITDLADGDVVVIAGAALTVTGSYLANEEGSQTSTQHAVIQGMFVDEVRRKPKTKKRRVYEEVATSEARVGDLITQNVLMGAAKRWSGDQEELEGCSVWRLVEETEVPR